MDIGPNILNLKQWIPQKDVIRLILKHLNPTDWKIVWAAHSKKYQKKLIKDPEFWKDCARYGYLDLIIWGEDVSACCSNLVFARTIFDIAVTYGHLHILKWGLREGFKPEGTEYMYIAAKNGYAEILQWCFDIRSHRMTDSEESELKLLYMKAIPGGHLNIIECLKENGIVPLYQFGYNVARCNQLHMLIWLRQNFYTAQQNYWIYIQDLTTCPNIKAWLEEQIKKMTKV